MCRAEGENGNPTRERGGAGFCAILAYASGFQFSHSLVAKARDFVDQELSLAYATGCENRKLFRDYP